MNPRRDALDEKRLARRFGMDVQQLAGQFVKSVADDPSLLKQFGVDPAQAVKDAVGVDLSDEDLGNVVSAVEPLLEGKDLDMGRIAEVAGDLLADGDILGKLGGLFGGK